MTRIVAIAVLCLTLRSSAALLHSDADGKINLTGFGHLCFVLAVLLEMKGRLYDPMNVLESWNEHNRSAVCAWNGIRCNEGRIAKIELPSQGLKGMLPSTLQGLEFLEEL